MKLLLWIVVIVVIVSGMTFMYYNRGTTASINLFGPEHAEVSTALIVAASILVGAVLIGVLALAEGATIRLENRKLRREMHKLGTEINYLRTTPPMGSRSMLDEHAPEPEARSEGEADDSGEPRPASAPVYGPEDDDWPPDPDDNPYSGGRAV